MYFTTQSKKSGANFTILVLAFLIGLVAQASAHGIMLTPATRLQHDMDKAVVIKMASDPTLKHPCGNGGYGPVTKYEPGAMMLFSYNVSITHGGNCYVQFNKYGDKEEDFYTVSELGECGKELGLVTALIEAPHEHCEKCTMRFMWNDDAGNLYLNCANVQIGDNKNNCMRKHRKTRRSLKF